MNKILDKIRYYLNKILKGKNIKLISENIAREEKDLKQNNNEESEIDRNEFFDIYNNVKNGTISIDDLMINDLIKIQLMLKKEINIYDEKADKVEDEILTMDTEIKRLKDSKKKYVCEIERLQLEGFNKQ